MGTWRRSHVACSLSRTLGSAWQSVRSTAANAPRCGLLLGSRWLAARSWQPAAARCSSCAARRRRRRRCAVLRSSGGRCAALAAPSRPLHQNRGKRGQLSGQSGFPPKSGESDPPHKMGYRDRPGKPEVSPQVSREGWTGGLALVRIAFLCVAPLETSDRMQQSSPDAEGEVRPTSSSRRSRNTLACEVGRRCAFATGLDCCIRPEVSSGATHRNAILTSAKPPVQPSR